MSRIISALKDPGTGDARYVGWSGSQTMKRAPERRPALEAESYQASAISGLPAPAPDHDPHALPGDPSQPDAINWSAGVTNGISVIPPEGWMSGDPETSEPPEWKMPLSVPEPSALRIVPKQSLREHLAEVDAIADTIEAMDAEELTEEVRAGLARLLLGAVAGTKKKVDATARVMAHLEHRAEAQKAERDLLDKGMKKSLCQLERLSDSVLRVLDAAGLDRIEGDVSTLARRRNPVSVVADTSLAGPLDRSFVREPRPAPWTEDKTAIRVAIAARHQVPGFACHQSVRLVRS
jgi:hypothetical protein